MKLSNGKSFGELALINKMPRAATVVALDNCHFATMGKKDYERVLAKIEIQTIDKKCQFFA